jgi:probable F420-dependent oxidoreductase
VKYFFIAISISPADIAEMAPGLEAAGYDGLISAETRHDPFVNLAVASQRASRLDLRTGVAIALARNPMSTAILANDLQLISGGKFALGLGSQLKAHITRRYAMPWSDPVRRMREYVLAIRAIFECFGTGERLRFRGEFYRHTLMDPFFNPGPNPYGNPPILLGGVGDLMTEMAGETADGFVVHNITTRKFLDEVTLPALRRGRKAAGKSMDGFELHFMPMVATGGTQEELDSAIRRARQQVAFYTATPTYARLLELHGYTGAREELHRLSAAGRADEMASVIDDEMLHTFAIVGEPAEVAARLADRFGDVAASIACYEPDVTDPQHWVPVFDELRKLAG